MSRKPEKMEENTRGSGKLIIYIAVAFIIAVVIISYIIIANRINNNKNIEKIAESETQEKQIEEQEIMISEISRTEEDDAENVSTQIGKTVEESSKESQEKSSEVKVEVQKQNTTTQKESTKNVNENVNNETKTEEIKKEISFAMPVEGEIIRGFAKDSLVYSETLQEWIVHQAIDIRANSRDVVKASAEGTITAIKNDPRYGLTVIIEHDGGFKTVYSNLLTAEFVVEGEQVKQGQTIGTIGSSAAFEISDESHLHFEMLKDSMYVDPTIYIK